MNEVIFKKEFRRKMYHEIKELDRQEVNIVIEEFFDTLKDIFIKGDGVTFRGTGSFKINKIKRRLTHNINDGYHELKERNVLRFFPSKKIKKLIKMSNS